MFARLPFRLSLLGLAASANLPVAAAVIDFSGNVCSGFGDGGGPLTACLNNSRINLAYGDSPGVDVSFIDVLSPSAGLRYWSTAYNNLQGVAWANGGDSSSRAMVVLQGDAGVIISLQSFDLGAWANTTRGTNVLVSNGSETFSFVGNVGAQPANLATHFNNFAAAGVGNRITIEWFNSAFNVGIDNITFSVSSVNAVPVPAAAWLLGSSLIGLAVQRRQPCT